MCVVDRRDFFKGRDASLVMRTLNSLLVTGLIVASAGCASSLPHRHVFSLQRPSNLSYVPRPHPHEKRTVDYRTVSPDDMVRVVVNEGDARAPSDWGCEDERQASILCAAPYDFVQHAITTPEQAQMYISHCLTHGNHGKPWGFSIDDELYGCGDYWASGRETHERKVGDCDDGAMAAASALKDDGYPGYILSVEGTTRVFVTGPRGTGFWKDKEFAHAVFLYRTTDGRFGSCGMNESDYRRPLRRSIDEFLFDWSNAVGDEYSSWTIYDVGRVFPDYDTNHHNNDLSK